MNTELFIQRENQWVQLDLSDKLQFPIIYNIADIKDISKRNSSFTKTINLPHTTTNSENLSYIFDIASDSTFDPRKKVKAYILVDTIQVFEGNFQLTGLKSSDNKHFSYEAVIYSDNDTLFKNIGDDFLTDLDFSELDHTYSGPEIEYSWTQSQSLGYYYPLIDYNNDWTDFNITQATIDPDELKPAIYVKTIWDKIFNSVNFTYDSTFLNSELFKNLIIPFGGDNLKQSPQFNLQNRFRAQVATSSNFIPQEIGTVPAIYFTLPSIFNFTVPFPIVLGEDVNIPYNDDTTFPNGDPSDKWDPLTFQFEAQSQDSNINQQFVVKFDIGLNVDLITAFAPDSQLAGGDIFIRVMREYNPNTGVPTPGGYPIPILNQTPVDIQPSDINVYNTFEYIDTNGNQRSKAYFLSTNVGFGNVQPFYKASGRNTYNVSPVVTSPASIGNFYRYTGEVETVVLDNTIGSDNIYRRRLFNGEKVWVEIFTHADIYTWDSFSASSSPILSFWVEEGTASVPDFGNYIYNKIDPNLLPGQDIDMNFILPEKIKQKDFLNSIIKMFNLYIDIDPTNPNNLIIEPREDYLSFNNGRIKDWTDKVDLLSDIEQKLIADLENKSILFTYKEDKDYFNSIYKTTYNRIYGDYELINENDFVSGEKKTELIFSPTPLVSLQPTTNNIVLPQILSTSNDSPNQNIGRIRILYKNYLEVLGTKPFWNFNGENKTYYPYAGHFDNPYDSTLDINFGLTRQYYFDNNSFVFNLTENNLFNVYHRKQLLELIDKNSRLITLDIYLTPQDISDFRFYDVIYLEGISSGTGNLFRVNKITYNPQSKRPSKVELIKLIDIDFTKDFTSQENYFNGGTNVNLSPERVSNSNSKITIGKNSYSSEGFGNIAAGYKNNIINGSLGIVTGKENLLTGGTTYSSIISGEKNEISGGSNNNISGGNNNLILGSKNSSLLGGNNNEIIGVTNSIIVGGEGQSVRESNRIKIGGILLSGTNYISAGRDEVLNPFPDDKLVTFISAGRDTIRNIGSESKENIITGGYNFTI